MFTNDAFRFVFDFFFFFFFFLCVKKPISCFWCVLLCLFVWLVGRFVVLFVVVLLSFLARNNIAVPSGIKVLRLPNNLINESGFDEQR